ncbi:YdcF family protein [Phenylobacterium sp.]|uniref:YdcF family protein n=1 Tax=Phenylobacterium sp. TaxID=1871053 RepID=UPI0025F1B9CF|nr:YdcF family protein [Phenylobacterium sp.]
MDAPPLIAIFGAAVGPSGRPSAALLRRIHAGFEAARLHPDAQIFCSGGVGRYGPSEASVMAQVLTRRDIAPDRLILDEVSLDTLQSVVAVARLARERAAMVLVCSDAYHVPRIRVTLSALGARSRTGPRPTGPYAASLGHRVRMGLRECAALPYDLAIAMARRGHLMSRRTADL